MTYREALTRATDQLSMHPELRMTALPDAALLLMHLLGIERATLIAHPERKLEREDQAAYQRLIERRLTFEPIQYITGTVEFYGLTLAVAPGVLIPRPETELLVEAILARVPPAVRILDVGTGSGAIAIALAKHLPQAEVHAVDISVEALRIAGANAANNQVEILFTESDLLASVEGSFDAIVSNPPYIAQFEAPSLATQVRDHEPPIALFGGASGLEIYERLIPQAHAAVRSGGLLALEIGYGQRDSIASLLTDWDAVEFLADLQGIPRVALARRP